MKNIAVEINSFGKIKHAKFEVKPFTIIAGKNASGKSFITRALYSVFSSLNKDHLAIDFADSLFRLSSLLEGMQTLTVSPSEKVSYHLSLLANHIDNIDKNIVKPLSQTGISGQLVHIGFLASKLSILKDTATELIKEIGSAKKYQVTSSLLKQLLDEIKILNSKINDPIKSLKTTLSEQTTHAFINNFQVNALSKLKNKEVAQSKPSLDCGTDIGSFVINDNQLNVEIAHNGIDIFQSLDNVVYLESPIYWKIKDVLIDSMRQKQDPALRRKRKHQQLELKKVPEYILDIFELLDSDIVQQPHPELRQLKQKINQCIGGQIQISDGGKLQFLNQTKQGEPYFVDMNQTATGTTALGIIALLLEKNIIVPNSVLIFDEPEVNLHPAWQQVMIQVLYQLSVHGVRIIMASHSFDMMETIEQLMETHEEQAQDVNAHFSIVQLDKGQSINHDKPIFKKLDAVKADLGMPLFNLFSKS